LLDSNMPRLRGTLSLSPEPQIAQAPSGQLGVQQVTGRPPSSAPTGNAEINLANILKLVPAEIVAPYIAGLDQINVYKPWGPPAWFLVSLVACVLLRADASRPATPPAGMTWWNQVNKSAVIVSAIAFLIWAHAVSNVPIFGWNNQTLAGLVAIVFGAVAPRFVSASAIA